MVNVTLCFSAAQALLAAKAGATFVSPFVGRLDDIGQDGMKLIADIVQIYRNYPALKTEVLVASVRHPIHVIEAAKLGAHVATLPPAVLRALYNHPLTDKGLAAFLADWAKTGQQIVDPERADGGRRRPTGRSIPRRSPPSCGAHPRFLAERPALYRAPGAAAARAWRGAGRPHGGNGARRAGACRRHGGAGRRRAGGRTGRRRA